MHWCSNCAPGKRNAQAGPYDRRTRVLVIDDSELNIEINLPADQGGMQVARADGGNVLALVAPSHPTSC
jgi:hypothetical protein